MQVHLRTEAVLAKEMITWQSESGIVENIEAVTAEYRVHISCYLTCNQFRTLVV